MSFEAALNLVWALVGAGSVGLLVCAEMRPQNRRAGRLGRIFALVLAVIFLFPCVSESDDLLTLDHLQFTPATVGQSGSRQPHAAGLQLVRLFENLGNTRISASFSLALILCFFFAITLFRIRTAPDRRGFCVCGRAPPERHRIFCR
jgi:hypothetical protein